MTTSAPLVTESGWAPGGCWGHAVFDTAHARRWLLARDWGTYPGTPMVWVLLNPSTAGAVTTDQTVSRCMAYAVREGCGPMEIVNLTEQVTPDPGRLDEAESAGGLWEQFLLDAVTGGRVGSPPPGGPFPWRSPGAVQPVVVLGWGGAVDTRPWLAARARHVRDLLRVNRLAWHALGFTATGQPWHPCRRSLSLPLLEGV